MRDTRQPAQWLVDHRHLLPTGGHALDLACGWGRHAFWLAAQGFSVDAVDRDPVAVTAVNDEARRLGVQVRGAAMDLEGEAVAIARQAFDVIVGFNYLHRPLFPRLIEALRPGGLLVYETFTRDQALRGKPSNPDFLLQPGELQDLLAPLRVLDAREGEYEGRCIASAVATAR